MLLKTLRRFDLPKSTDLSHAVSYHLTALLLLISLPMMVAFPPWLAGLVLLSVGLKWYSIRSRFHVSRGVTFAIFCLSAVLIAINFTTLGREYAGVVFLLVMASLKLLEAKAQRDAFLLMLIYFLLIMSGLMTSQSPLVFFYLFACLLYNIYIQLRAAQPSNIRLSWQQLMKSIGKMTLVALPFVLVLFFFFPRIEPLWKQPGLPGSQTGLSEDMSPSGLSELAQNGSLAFRVIFTDGSTPPPNRDLYWRGPVLSQFDGTTWRRDSSAPLSAETTLNVVENSQTHYTIYHNGSSRQWVLPLDMPLTLPSQTQLNVGREVQATNPVTKPTAFTFTSYTQYQLIGLSDAQRHRYTTLPSGFPKARALAKQLYATSKNDSDFIQKLLQYFNENPYYYDLSSPAGNDNIDTFLFDNRAGYCEHYSSAFAFMLRSVGIPTRVIIGYQGGEMNQISNEMEVKQLNAHAWVEAYLPQQGWTRFDPTAAVAPERVISGSPLGVAENADLIDFTARLEGAFNGYRYLSESLRALSGFWQNWIINYNQNKQDALWQRLGLNAMPPLAWILAIFSLAPLVVLAVLWYRRRRQRNSGDSIQRTMQPFMRHLQHLGLTPAPHQPLLAFIQSQPVQDTLQQSDYPNAPKAAKNIVTIYYQLRYGNHTHVDELKNAVTHFIRQQRK